MEILAEQRMFQESASLMAFLRNVFFFLLVFGNRPVQQPTWPYKPNKERHIATWTKTLWDR